MSQGRPHRAVAVYQEALRLATAQTDPSASTLSAVGMAYAGLAEIECERNHLNQANQYALKAIELGKLGGLATSLTQGYLALARIKEAQFDIKGALDTLQAAEQIIHRSKVLPWMARASAYKAQLWVRQYQLGQDEAALQAAIRWAQTSNLQQVWSQQKPSINTLSPTFNCEHLALARVFVTQKKFADALELLAWLLQRAEAAGRRQNSIEFLVLQAFARQAQGDIELALAALKQACTLAESENYIRVFVNEGPPLAVLLAQLPVTPYRERLMAAFSKDNEIATWLQRTNPDFSHKLAPDSSGRPLPVDPLSRREREVLNLSAVGCSNRQIA